MLDEKKAFLNLLLDFYYVIKTSSSILDQKTFKDKYFNEVDEIDQLLEKLSKREIQASSENQKIIIAYFKYLNEKTPFVDTSSLTVFFSFPSFLFFDKFLIILFYFTLFRYLLNDYFI